MKSIRVLGCMLVLCGLQSVFWATQARADGDPTSPAPNAKKDWTMLVYLNGNNNLDSYGSMNLVQMQQVGSTDRLNVVVQWASMAANDTKRLYMKKDPSATTVTSPVVQTLPVVDMGSKDTLTDFIKWGVKTYPSDHLFVVVWNHGGGWHLQSMNEAGGGMHAQDISWDERSGHHITTEELGQVITDTAKLIGHKVDIYGSDACLMAMIEVAQEMGTAVETFVGSEETEPGDGWPYDIFLKSWTANPQATSKEIGTYLVQAYNQYYTAQSMNNATFSAIDMTQLPALVKAMSNLKTQLLTADLSKVKDAAEKSTRFTYSDYVDVLDVVNNLKQGITAQEVQTQVALDDVSAQVAKTVISASATGGMAANGISVWWPTESYDWTSYSDRYKGLQFDKASGWHELLEKLF